MILEGIEIAVVVEQFVAVLDAARGDDRVDRPANGHTESSQGSEVARGLKRDIPAAEFDDGEAGEQLARCVENALAREA